MVYSLVTRFMHRHCSVCVNVSCTGENFYYNTHVGQDNENQNRRLLVLKNKAEKIPQYHTANLVAHTGVNGKQDKVARKDYWHGMKDDVRRYESIVFEPLLR